MDAIEKLTATRAALAVVIELLIAITDDLDGDEHLEDDTEDRAADDDPIDANDSGDDEPWLGRLETIDQGGASYGGSGDFEADIQDEPHDDERSLV